MCAIAGLIDKNNLLDDNKKRQLADKLISTLSHRGGDGDGVYIKDNIVMTHNRLSIIDLTENSNQPVYDNLYALSYNGEIYNYKELDNMDIKSDTQFLFRYLKNKLDINQLDGMFAYSFIDLNNNVLSLQVDRFGIKPLYYFENDNYFIWASEIKAIKAICGDIFEFNEEALSEYMMFRCISSNHTLIKNLYKVLPGENITINLTNYKLDRYKSILQFKNKVSDNLSKSDIYNMVENGIKRCLLSDVPVGVQLSGGIDSSLVALIASDYKGKINTYSIGMDDTKWNEFKYSRYIAEKIGSNHKEILFSKRDFIDNFKKVTYLLDEPICHPNTVPMYILAKEARKDVKVLMTGEGADEILGGDKRYANLANDQDFNIVNSYQSVQKILKKCDLGRRMNIYKSIDESDKLKKYCKYDVLTFLPGVLVRQDKASMGGNIESRVPFLSNEISDLLFNLSLDYKIGRFGNKNLLKEMLVDKYNLPIDFVTRDKCGFGLPISEWLRDEDVFLQEVMNVTKHDLVKEYFNVNEIETLINQHINNESDNSSVLFTIVSLVVWYDIFIMNAKNN